MNKHKIFSGKIFEAKSLKGHMSDEISVKWRGENLTLSDFDDKLYDEVCHAIKSHVYCTNCQHFRADDEYLPYCPFEDKCNIWNCEDSKPFRERPRYEPKD